MSDVFVIIKMCYVHNQWYDISCATLYYKICYKILKLKNTEWPLLNLICHKYRPCGVWGLMRQFPYWVSNKIYVYLCDWLLSLSEFMERVRHFYQCWKHQWNLIFGIMCKMFTDYFSVLVASWKWCPRSCNLILGNKKKS